MEHKSKRPWNSSHSAFASESLMAILVEPGAYLFHIVFYVYGTEAVGCVFMESFSLVIAEEQSKSNCPQHA